MKRSFEIKFSISVGILVLLMTVLSGVAFGEDLIVKNDPGPIGTYEGETLAFGVDGQSFTATKTGILSRITVSACMNGDATLNIYNGEGTSGALLHTQSVEAQNTLGTTEGNRYILCDFDINGTVNIISGNTYTFTLGPIGTITMAFTVDSYSGGAFYRDGTQDSGYDLMFQIVQSDPSPTPHAAAIAEATTSAPIVGADNSIKLTVKDSLGNTDTGFSGAKNVTIKGVEAAPDGTYGSFNGTALSADSAGAGQVISVPFSNGVATANLKLNKADGQTVVFSIATVTSPETTLTITPTHGTALSMAVTQDITKPAVNGENFAQQPVITIKDAYGNICTSDNTTVVTADKEDAGSWTLTGTKTVTASAGVAAFTNLGATNAALVNNAQLGFTAGTMAKVTSSTVTLPAPAGSHTAGAAADTLTPAVGVDNEITLTVRNSIGNTDTGFSGAKNVTIKGVEAAPDGTYGSFNGTVLTADSAGAGQVISVIFTNGVATANLKLNKADGQTVGFSIATVTTPATNTLSIAPAHGTAASMAVTQNVTAPASNGGTFAQQPKIAIKDAYGNICTSDSTSVVTADKEDAGAWTLTGTATAKASAGVAAFTNLGATNAALVNNAQLGFTAGTMTKVTSSTVTLPAPAGNHTATASAATLTPGVGVDDAITLTVKNSLSNTDTGFSGAKNVTVKGVEAAPDGTYGSFNGTVLTADSAGAGQVISMIFTNGVATANLKLNKADGQTIGFSIATVTTPATNTLSIAPAHGTAASMAVTQNVTAPASNGGTFAQQPKIAIKDAYGNICTSDNTSVVTAAREDAGAWTLTGTATAKASAGVAAFTNLGATNAALVNNAQLGFTSGTMTKVTSSTVTLPAPAGNHTATASAATLTPGVGVDNAVTLTVKNSLGNTDTGFSGAKNVTIKGVEAAPDGTYGSFNGTALTADSAGAGQVISVIFTNGDATANLKLNKADGQTVGFSIATVTTPATNTLSIAPAHGTAASMAVTQNVTAPASNGGTFAQQPKIAIKDAYGNICTSDSTSVVTADKEDAGAWTLTGTATAKASAGVAAFANLGATNASLVNNAQLGFTSGTMTKVTSSTVTLPAPAGNHTATASAATLTPGVGVDNAITLTVKNSLSNTDTGFSGAKNVTIKGVEAAPDGTYGSFNGTALDANSAGGGQVISVSFTNGVATANLKLNKADGQTIGFSIATVTTPATNMLTITLTHGTAASMAVTQNITAPASNGGTFAQQPKIAIKDAYGNICTSDSTSVVTADKEDAGAWTLTGTATAKASAGVAAFANLGATNAALVNNAQLGFTAGTMTKVTSSTVTLPAPAGNHTATASAATLTPGVGVDNAVTLTVKNSLGNTDTDFNGAKNVTIKGVEAAPDGTYGSFNGIALDASAAGGQVISVSFTNGVATANLKLNKADGQTIGFSIATVTTPATNTLTITLTHGTAASMAVTQNVTAPASNGGTFAQQPKIAIKDAYGNICTSDNTTVVTAVKEDAGVWTLTGTKTATANAGVAAFTNLGATNAALVNNAQMGFTSGTMTKVTSSKVTLPAPAASNNGGTSGSGGGTVTPPPSPEAVVVIVNGKEQDAGKETETTEDGKTTVTVQVNNTVIGNKIDEAIKNNTTNADNVIQIPVANTKSEVAKVELTGDIVKKLENNTFDVSVKHDKVEYVIPAEEFTISKVAENLGVSVKNLEDIKVEVKITKLDQTVVDKFNEEAKANGAELVFPPVSFEVVAKTTKVGGSTEEVEISKFSNFVERVMEIPVGVDPGKITTGIVFNPDGTYSHVPTEVFQKDGKWYAKLNSLTNSEYSVIWNPVTVKSVENHWAKDAVNAMASRLVIFNHESFAPDKAITRADFAEYIVRALGLYREGSKHVNKFKDVSATGDRSLAILIAGEYGIVDGYSDGTFKPNVLITREEAMTMYQRAMKITKLNGSDPNRYQTYTDFAKVSTWAASSVKEVLSAHVFNGTNATDISPKANLTYAEAAQAIKNLLVESKLINK